jgi:hypothetical protein
MVGTNIFILLILLVFVLVVITLLLLAAVVRKERSSTREKEGKSSTSIQKMPHTPIEDDISLSGGALMDEDPTQIGEYQRLDGQQDLLVSQSTPARKNGRPH